MREFSLGNETLQCFVDRETLYKVHECVFAVRALESEPVATLEQAEALGARAARGILEEGTA